MRRIRVAVVVPSDSPIPTPPWIRIPVSIEARISPAPIAIRVAIRTPPTPAVRRMAPTPAARASSPGAAMWTAARNWASAEPASAMGDESAMTSAAHGHSTAAASLPPHRSGQQSCAYGRNGQPAMHGYIIALSLRRLKRPNLAGGPQSWPCDRPRRPRGNCAVPEGTRNCLPLYLARCLRLRADGLI